MFLAKNCLRKHQIFENWGNFENRPSCKGLCKIVSFGQKLKFKKTCEKRFFNDMRVVLCKKQLEKTLNIREMRRFWKSAITQRLKLLQNSQFGSKIKIGKKNAKNDSLIILELFCAKNRLRKHQIFEKWDDFEICHHARAKKVSLGQKLKLKKKTWKKRFFCYIRVVVVCKKPLLKTPNLQEMRRFLKSAIMQRL